MPDEIGGDQREQAEHEESAVAVNEKLDAMVIAENLSYPSWVCAQTPRAGFKPPDKRDP